MDQLVRTQLSLGTALHAVFAAYGASDPLAPAVAYLTWRNGGDNQLRRYLEDDLILAPAGVRTVTALFAAVHEEDR